MTRPYDWRPEYSEWQMPEYFGEEAWKDANPTMGYTPLGRAHSAIMNLITLADDLTKENPVPEFNQEIQAAKAKLTKAQVKATRAEAKVKEAEKRLRSAEAKAMPKEPTARASLGTGHSIPPVVFFRKPVAAGGFASYCAVRRGSSEWAVVGIVRLFTWAALLEFMGEEGRRTLAVTDASSWHKPERGA